MADKTIGELPSASAIYDDSLLVMEQQGEARSVLGSLFRGFAEAAAKEHADIARSHMDAARASAAVAAESLARLNGQAELAEEARKGAEKAREAIEDMTVSAETLPCWSEATAVKTATESSFSIHFGIPAGRGFTILGRYDSREELEAAVPDPAVGDAYQVGAGAPYDVYIYDDVNGWVNSGPINVDLPAHLIVGEDSELGTALPVNADTLEGHGAEYFAVRETTENALQRKTGENILHNAQWDKLEYIVNQRGVSGTIETPGYFIDRWKLISGTVTVQDGGLILNGTIVQILESDPGDGLIASVLTSDGFGTAAYAKTNKTFSVTATGQMLLAAKLERGSQQTLAHKEGDKWVLNEIPDYGVELARCQRYQLVLPDPASASLYNLAGIGLGTSEPDLVRIGIPLPTPLRASPTVILEGKWRAVDETEPYYQSGLSVESVNSVEPVQTSTSMLNIFLDVPGISVGKVYNLVYLAEDGPRKMIIDANL